MRDRARAEAGTRRIGRTGILAGVVMVGLMAAAVAVAKPLGSVQQASGKKGCLTWDGESPDGPDTCKNIRGSAGATGVVVSPDGKFAYSVGYGDTGSPEVLSAFKRNKKGALKQIAGKKGCYSGDGSSEDGPKTCKGARNLGSGDGRSLAISKDGRFLYGASQDGTFSSGGVTIFERNKKKGTLKQLPNKKGCVTGDGSTPEGSNLCKTANGVAYIASVQISPDQKYLYANNYDSYPESGLAVFKRNKKSGTIKQLKGKDGCVTGDGTTQESTPSVVCRAAPALIGPFEVGLPDNKFVYAPNYDHDLIAVLKRNKKGGLVPLSGTNACISDDASSASGPGTCKKGKGLADAERAVPSKNGKYLYVTGYNPMEVSVFDRNKKNGKLSQRSGTAACISSDGSSSADGPGTCRDGRGLRGGYTGTLSPDGKTLYFVGYSDSSLLTFRVNKKSGAFSQLAGKNGCLTEDGGTADEGPGVCADGRGVINPYEVTTSPDGKDVYVASYGAGGIAHFSAKVKKKKKK